MKSKAAFDSFAPKLKAGNVSPSGRQLVYETSDGELHIVLPIEVADILVLATGRYTMRQIVEKVYKLKGFVHFRTIFTTIHQLRDHGFLENGDELENVSWWASHDGSFDWWHKVFSISKRISWKQPRPTIFYLLSLALVAGEILSALWIPWPPISTATFLYDGSLTKGFFVAIGLFLFFQFAQALLKVLLQLLLTGNAFGLAVKLYPWGPVLSAKDEPVFLVTNRLFLSLFHTAILLLPMFLSSMLLGISVPVYEFGVGVAIIKLIFDLSPYTASPFMLAIRSLLTLSRSDLLAGYLNEKSLLYLLGASIKKKTALRIRVLFISYLIMWSAVVFWGAVKGLYIAGMAFSIEPLTALLLWFFTGGIVVWLAAQSFLQIRTLTARSMAQFRTYLKARARSKNTRDWSSSDLVDLLSQLPLFSYFSTSLLEKIIEKSEVTRVQAGSRIITQGEIGRDLFVLLSGSLAIEKSSYNEGHRRLTILRPYSIFGEMAIVEENERTADVISLDSSSVIRIPASIIRRAADQSQYLREIEAFRNAILVNQFFSSAPMFKDLPEDIVYAITMKSGLKSYKAGETIIRQGDFGRSFFMVLRGSVQVRIDDRSVKRIRQGGFFGEISLIADIPRTASILTLEPTVVMEMSNANFWEIMCQNIELAMFIESVGESRLSEEVMSGIAEAPKDTKAS